jgi:pilus assembly protein Flp/PilA
MLYLPVEEGQGLAEYGLILILVAVLIVAILTVLGTQVSNMFSRVESTLPNPG